MSDEERERGVVGSGVVGSGVVGSGVVGSGGGTGSSDVERAAAPRSSFDAHEHLAAAARVERDGFAIVAGAIEAEQRAAALGAFAELDGRVGRRDALDHPGIAQLAAAPRVRRLAESVLGPGAAVHRAILFDKSPDANWLVRWHQDTVISVPERFDAPGWTAWSVKDGVPCARPPRDVLDALVSIRVDLDGSDAGNGGLRVVPTSHAHGVLTPEAAAAWRERAGEVDCTVPALGALVLRPLLLHASRKSPSGRNRRIVHLEFRAWPVRAPIECVGE